VPCDLDSISLEVYVELDLIEARAAAILTPHPIRHAPAVFLERFSVSSHVLVIHSDDQGWQERLVLNKLFEDKLLRQVFFR
jgi:hypothetical protein